MPVRQLRPRQSPNHQALVSSLVDEWKQQDSQAAEPVILEEFNNAGDLIHVYVVWDVWRDMDRTERGEIIMEAAEQRYGHPDVDYVTIAMGLTPREADQMDIDWR